MENFYDLTLPADIRQAAVQRVCVSALQVMQQNYPKQLEVFFSSHAHRLVCFFSCHAILVSCLWILRFAITTSLDRTWMALCFTLSFPPGSLAPRLYQLIIESKKKELLPTTDPEDLLNELVSCLCSLQVDCVLVLLFMLGLNLHVPTAPALRPLQLVEAMYRLLPGEVIRTTVNVGFKKQSGAGTEVTTP